MPKPRKSKPIHKSPKTPLSIIPDRLPDPQLTSLTDFVVSLSPTFTSKAIYTGGRILSVGNTLFCACDGSIVYYETQNINKDENQHKTTHRLQYSGQQVANFGVSGDGKLIATYTNAEILRIHLISSSKVMHLVKLPKYFPMDIVFSPDCKHLALGFANSHIKIYTVETLRETHSYQAHKMGVRKLMWHPRGQLLQLISSDQANTVVVFDYILNKVIGRAENAGKTFALSPTPLLNYSQSHPVYILTASSTSLHLYSYPSLSLITSIDLDVYVEHIYFLPQGNKALIGGEQTNLMQVGVQFGTHNLTIAQPDQISGWWDNGIGKILSLSGGKKCAVVTIQQNIVILDTATLKRQKTIVGYNDEILDIKYSKAPSPYYLMITNSPTFKLFNSSTNMLQALVPGHSSTILASAYCHPVILTAGKDAVVRQWNVDVVGRVQEIARYSGHAGEITAVAGAWGKGTFISGGGDGVIKVWGLQGGGFNLGGSNSKARQSFKSKQGSIHVRQALHTIQAHQKSINSIRMSPKQDMIATCSHDRNIHLLDSSTLSIIFALNGHRRPIHDTAFHPLEPLLLSCSSDGMLKCWSTKTFQCLWSMGEGAALLRCEWIYFNQCVTVGSDGVLKLWDVRKKGSLSWDKHDGKIWALQVRKVADGKCEVITGGSDSTMLIWSDNTATIRNSILQSTEHDQQQSLLIAQHIHAKQYLQAASLAFRQNYIGQCIEAIRKMLSHGDEEDWQIKYDEETNRMVEQGEGKEMVSAGEIKGLLKEMWESDADRLLNLLLSMNSSVKHCHSAIRLLHFLLRIYPINKLLELSSTFKLPQHSLPKQSLISPQSDLEIFLSTMLMYTQRHQTRIQRYVKDSYGIQQQINQSMQ